MRYFLSWQFPVISAICILAYAHRSAGAVIVSSSELATILDAPGGNDGESHGFTTVQNPFVDSHIAMPVPTSFAQAAYNFVWTELNASFQTSISHQAHDVPSPTSLYCRASGFIFVQPSLDSVLSIQSSYTYALPADSFLAQQTILVRDMSTNMSIWSDSRAANSFGGNPVTGTFAVTNGSIQLMGGRTYLLNYDYRLQALSGGTDSTGTGTGGILWTLNPVPEPASLSTLAYSIPLLRRRRRRTANGQG